VAYALCFGMTASLGASCAGRGYGRRADITPPNIKSEILCDPMAPLQWRYAATAEGKKGKHIQPLVTPYGHASPKLSAQGVLLGMGEERRGEGRKPRR